MKDLRKALQALVAKAHSFDSSDDPIYYAEQALSIFERYHATNEAEVKKILNKLVKTELTILPTLKGKQEKELRDLIWRAHDALKKT